MTIAPGGLQVVLGERPELLDATHVRLEHAPRASEIALYRNGVRQAAGEDYVVSGDAVTLLFEWDPVNDLVVVDYWR